MDIDASYFDPVETPLTSAAFRSAAAYMEALLWVLNPQGRLVPFKRNYVQRRIDREMTTARKIGRPPRFLIPKSRKAGVTTHQQARSFAMIANHVNHRAMTIADVDDKSEEIFEMVTRFYENLPPELRPSRKTENKRELHFDRMKSKFRIGTIGSTGAGRGLNYQRIHGSEVGSWLPGKSIQHFDYVMTGILEAARHGEVVLESTSNGDSGWWFETIIEAIDVGNEWTVIFIPWWEDPGNQMPVFDEQEAWELLNDNDPQIQKLIQQYKLTPPQLKFRHEKRQERSMRLLFDQEYPEDLRKSFLSSSYSYFPSDVLTDLEHKAKDPILDQDGITIWVNPVEGGRYVAGADCSAGVQGGDFQVLGILDFETGEQVATARGYWPPDKFARICAALCRKYNEALLGVETNYGRWVLKVLQDLGYSNLYQRMSRSSKGRPDWAIGYQTDEKERPRMLEDLLMALAEGHMLVNDANFLRECRAFVLVSTDRGFRYEARQGQHDDTIFAWGIAWQVRKGTGRGAPRITIL